jgi:hypothetical protein
LSRGPIAIASFMPETYDAARAAMDDRASLPESYAAWAMSARQVEGELERVGFTVIRVPLDLDDFLAWCGGQGMAPTAKARSAYAAARAQGA